MKFGIYTLDDFNFAGKVVLLRVDINEPVDHATDSLKDITRIRACIPTIRELVGNGAKLVVMGHQGSDIEYQNYYTTRPHAAEISDLLGKEIQWIDDVTGPAARERISALKPGEILLLDNVRFVAEEQTLFEEKLRLTHEQQTKTQLVTKLAPLADLYVCDAFAAAHRDQPSLCGFEEVLPSAMGRLFEKEYCVVSQAMQAPQHPCLFVLGGAKVADAFAMMHTVLSQGAADFVLTGGIVAQIMLAAKGISIGTASMEYIEKHNLQALLPSAQKLLGQYKEKIIIPMDLAYLADGKRCETPVDKIPDEFEMMDIGRHTIHSYSKLITAAETIFVNGPMGVFENPELESGTKEIWSAIANSKAYSIVGGGDSVTAANRFDIAQKMSYICTGGGALIRFLSGEELPVVTALRHAAQKFGNQML